MGEMSAYYAACDVAFVGGSLLPFGAQNLIEACAVGAPVLIGPSTFNFAEAAAEAVRLGAAIQVADADALVREAARLLADPGARACDGRGGDRVLRRAPRRDGAHPARSSSGWSSAGDRHRRT